MNFEKFYTEFQAAKAVHDLERMSNFIAQATDYYCEFIKAGKKNEIPSDLMGIVKHLGILVYNVMNLLGSGKGDKAIAYLATINKINSNSFDFFFYLRYLLGRALYLMGNYSSAITAFAGYEERRTKEWNAVDADELSLFYRANSLAMLGDFNSAAQLYEQILTIKADFPEVKNNIELVLRGTNENLNLEVKSLWNFPYWRDVPIFINSRDRLGVTKKLIDWLLAAGYRKLIVLDNASTYPPLLEYYSALERDSRIKIIRLGKNLGFKALWLSGILEQLKISTPYIYTDPDVLPIEDCLKDFVKQLMKFLDSNHELRKVGLGLVYDDITFFGKDAAQAVQRNFYEGTQIGDDVYYAQIDTTFALYSNVRHYSLRFSLRTTGDLRAYHLPWYFDYDNLPADERYYLEHADKNSVTTVKKFLEVKS